MNSIYKKEFKDYFITGSGQIIIIIYLILSGLMFYINNVNVLSSDLGAFFSMMGYVTMLVAPVLSMKAFATELKQGTNILLLAYPISTFEIVLGKYLSIISILTLALLGSLIYPLMILIWGQLYFPEMIVGYIGVFLLGAAYIALDLFLASFTKNIFSSFSLMLFVNVFFWLLGIALSAMKISFLKKIMGFLDLHEKFLDFSFGQLNFSSIMFFITFIVASLTLANLILRLKRIFL